MILTPSMKEALKLGFILSSRYYVLPFEWNHALNCPAVTKSKWRLGSWIFSIFITHGAFFVLSYRFLNICTENGRIGFLKCFNHFDSDPELFFLAYVLVILLGLLSLEFCALSHWKNVPALYNYPCCR